MKKKIVSIVVGVAMVCGMMACGKAETTSTEGITFPEYKGIEVQDVPLIEATDEDVEMAIAKALESHMLSTDITDRPIQNGDIVNIDYSGTKVGETEPFEGGTAEGTGLEIGSGTFIPGFEEGLIGYNVGDEVDLEITFPEEYQSEDLAGAAVVFHVKVNSISEHVIPELTDDFVTEVSETSTTVEEYREEVKNRLDEQNLQSQLQARQSQVWTQLMEKTVVETYPEEMMTENEAKVREQYEMTAEQYQMTIEEFVEANGITMEEYEKVITEQAQQRYTSAVVVQYIADNEKIELTDEEYEEKVNDVVTMYGYESKEALLEEVNEEDLKLDFLTERVIEWLVENTTFVETQAEATPEEDTSEEDTSEENVEE